jgi:hypothetical protein
MNDTVASSWIFLYDAGLLFVAVVSDGFPTVTQQYFLRPSPSEAVTLVQARLLAQ